jgi:hypothetical protein
MFRDDDTTYSYNTFRRDQDAIRAARRSGRLTPEEIAEYDAAGFDWAGYKERTAAQWKDLEDYLAKHGEAPKRSTKLGGFHDSRMASGVPGEREKLLALRKKHKILWQEEKTEARWIELEAYLAKNHRLPPQRTPLGSFASGRLSAEPKQMLALRKKYGIETQHEETARKWKLLEACYRATHRPPSRKITDGHLLSKFEKRKLRTEKKRVMALRKKYDVMDRLDRREAVFARLEAFYRNNHRRPPLKDKQLRGFEKKHLAGSAHRRERIHALWREYGISSREAKVKSKWVELEAYLAKHHELPGQRTALGVFSANRLTTESKRMLALRRKYSIKTRLDAAEDKRRQLEVLYRAQKRPPFKRISVERELHRFESNMLQSSRRAWVLALRKKCGVVVSPGRRP